MKSNKTTKLSLSHDNILAHNISVRLPTCDLNLLVKLIGVFAQERNTASPSYIEHGQRRSIERLICMEPKCVEFFFSVLSIIESSHSQLAKKHEETTRFMRANLIKWSLFVMKKRKEKNARKREQWNNRKNEDKLSVLYE